MTGNAAYIAAVVNSTIRSATPIILASLGSLLCERSGVFNIALEGQMLIACFVSIAVNSATHSWLLSILFGVLSGGLMAMVVAFLQVKFRAADAVVGTSVNLLAGALTTLLLNMIYGVRGTLSDPKFVSIPKITLSAKSASTFVGSVFDNLSIVDYGAYIIAVLVWVYLFKTVAGFRLRSIGINKEASISMGQKAVNRQMNAVIASGLLCGLAGCALSMGQVRLFTENMTAGRGFIAMAATSMGGGHPLWILLSSLFFGASQAIGVALQQKLPSQLTLAVPYLATVIVLCITALRRDKRLDRRD
jgi:simple sugar transport system permease protein